MAGRGIRQCLHDITAYLIVLIGVATLASLQFGFHLAELNAPQDVITCQKKSISTASRVAGWIKETAGKTEGSSGWLPDCIPMSEAAFATVSSIFTVGGLAGALAAGPFASKRGRLPAMRTTALLYMVGAALEALAGSVFAMSAGRLISGLGAGASTVIVPLYISEMSPPDERGLFGAMTQVSINVGIILTQTLGYFLSYGHAWRWVLGIGVCIATAQFFGLFVVPESPAWLAAHGDPTKAKRTLQRIRGSGFDIHQETSHWGAAAADAASTQEAEEEGLLGQTDGTAPPSPTAPGSRRHMGFMEVVKDINTRPAIIAVVGIMVTQQFCGINSIIMYSVSLLADLLPVSSGKLTIIISAVNLGMTIACAPLPDRLGRKTSLLISIIGQGSSSLILALSIVFGAKVLSAFAVLAFVAFFAVGLGPVPFIMASELVGQEAVGATQSWSLAANYMATFIVAQFFPIVNTALNRAFGGAGWVYFLFAGLAALGAMFVGARVPETRGKKDADEVWGRTRRLD
ncbi:General substrate transporter [Metarhizium album ARSEF 1941]|uniref:General substrate transporter n=1 Tax=Metarhizium album (strain ARSEF 1941) TaxID=1081103 RepID=A0A0B2WMY6_METAS|nr:General substrate transporter [Metarhizium album ARSEF 1941]KHN94852.1 General substrate transporter [Metarhizium album ARSEF 1941]